MNFSLNTIKDINFVFLNNKDIYQNKDIFIRIIYS